LIENHFADKHLVDADSVECPRRLNDGIVGTSTKRRVGETSVGQMFFDEKTWNQYGARKALFPLPNVPSD
jgi:hypothetical protein